MGTRKPRFGRLPPRYLFALNPHAGLRASSCPHCDRPTYPRKFALLIHVDPDHLRAISKTCKYCSRCELIIAHQDELEAEMAQHFLESDPSAVGNDYLVLGTVELKTWREGLSQPKSIAEMLAHTADFKDHRTIEHFPGGWYPKDFVLPIPARRRKGEKRRT